MKRIVKIFFVVLGMGLVAGFTFTLIFIKPAQSQNSPGNLFLGPGEIPARLSFAGPVNSSGADNMDMIYDDSTYFNEAYFPNNSADYYPAGLAPSVLPSNLQPASSILDQAVFEVRSLIALYNVSNPASAVFYDVPVKSQQDYLNGTACVPTSIIMVLDYYHQTDPALTTETISKFIADLEEGDITEGYGISVSKIVDDLWDLGYRNSFYLNGSQINLNALIGYLKEGPVIVQTGLELAQNPRRIHRGR